jgi:hypothetical protein
MATVSCVTATLSDRAFPRSATCCASARTLRRPRPSGSRPRRRRCARAWRSRGGCSRHAPHARARVNAYAYARTRARADDPVESGGGPRRARRGAAEGRAGEARRREGACVCAPVCVCTRACVHVCVRACVCACVLTTATRMQAQLQRALADGKRAETRAAQAEAQARVLTYT